MMDDEIRTFGYCEECGNRVTDEYDTYYVNDDGEIFCCVDCALEHYGITQVEV